MELEPQHSINIGSLRFQAAVPFKLKNGNDSNGNYSWRVRAGWKKQADKAIQDIWVSHDIGYDKEQPVVLMVTRVLGPRMRLWDADSVNRGNCKQLVDSFVQAGYLIDDGPKYVRLAIGNQIDDQRDAGPKCTIISLYQ